MVVVRVGGGGLRSDCDGAAGEVSVLVRVGRRAVNVCRVYSSVCHTHKSCGLFTPAASMFIPPPPLPPPPSPLAAVQVSLDAEDIRNEKVKVLRSMKVSVC